MSTLGASWFSSSGINYIRGGFEMKSAARVPLAVLIPPPLLFVLTFLSGVGMQHLMPLTVSLPSIVKIGHIVGDGLLAAGILLALSCMAIFLLVRTTLIPFGTAAKLVTRGPYRITRNPMYVSLVLVYVGVVGLLTQAWPLFLLPFPRAINHRAVIPIEEARMREVFGDAFEQYCSSVHRWI
jgi:protein-S-isoprenylcysteine O-methyltransferase Ste14